MKPVSDRKIRVGIVGYGVCKFGAEFGFQNHPNVEVVEVSDLIPERCAGLAAACRCARTHPSLEEHICVTGGSFTEVSCQGIPSEAGHLQPGNNPYRNAFGTEIALFRTSEGGSARMAVNWDTPGFSGEKGRGRGQRGTFYEKYEGLEKEGPVPRRPALPRGVPEGGHGGSHGHLMNEFVSAILENRPPMAHVAMALNLTMAGIVAHASAIKGGELLKIPQYRL